MTTPIRGPQGLSGWWLGHPSEKYEFVNWDDDSNPILMGKCIKIDDSNPILMGK